MQLWIDPYSLGESRKAEGCRNLLCEDCNQKKNEWVGVYINRSSIHYALICKTHDFFDVMEVVQ